MENEGLRCRWRASCRRILAPSAWKVLTVSPSVGALDQLADALGHFLRRLVGEGDGGDVRGRDLALLDQVGDLLGDDAGLAAAGAGQHQQRAVEIAHRLALRRVERVRHRERLLKLAADRIRPCPAT